MANSLTSDEIYCRNMAALFRADAKLAQRIDECPPDSSIQVEASRSGPATCSVLAGRSPAGQRVFLHSRIDPIDEAHRWANAVEVGDNFCYMVGGFGLGHHLKALHARLKGDAFIVVTEADLALLRAAVETVDLAELFAGDRCIILTSADNAEIQTRLAPRNTLLMMGAQFLAHAPSERINGEFQASMRKLLTGHLTYTRMSLMTLVGISRASCTNVAYNLPTYVSTPPIDILRERFRGHPGIIVSAGPSLRRNIDQLAALKGRAVIISVQTTFKTLLDRGIQPDFVTSLDYHEMSRRFFENVGNHGGTHLISEPKAHWEVIDAFHGPVSLLDNSFARQCLGEALGARAGLKAGATVAHLAFYLAVYMGCEPIVLVGQDLGYSDHVYYVPGTAIYDLWRPELNRFNTVEMREWDRIARQRKILMKVKDVHGHDIYTDEQLFTYLQQFEGDFANVPGRVIDATEGGVRKASTVAIPLAEVAARYCRELIPADRFGYRSQLNWRDTTRLAPAKREIEQRLAESEEMSRICEEMLVLLNEMNGLLDRPEAFNKKFSEVDRLRVRVRASQRVYDMAVALSQHAELQRFSADHRMGLADLDSVSRARRQLERDMRFVQGIAEGIQELRRILTGCLQRFEKAMD